MKNGQGSVQHVLVCDISNGCALVAPLFVNELHEFDDVAHKLSVTVQHSFMQWIVTVLSMPLPQVCCNACILHAQQ
jgi:hypothetical protein